MSTPQSTVEITPLEGIDLDGAPPCDALEAWHLFGLARFLGLAGQRECGRPATHRVRITCPAHGTGTRFLCGRCLRYLNLGLMTCNSCQRGGRDTPVSFAGHS